jgi:hypothetical protein
MSELKLSDYSLPNGTTFLLDSVLGKSNNAPDDDIGTKLHVALRLLITQRDVNYLHNTLAEIRKHGFDRKDTRIRNAIIKNLELLLAENPPPTELTDDIKLCVNCALMKLKGNPEVLPGGSCSLCDTKQQPLQPTVTSPINPKANSSSSSSETPETQPLSSSPKTLEPQGPNMWLLVPYAIALAVSSIGYKVR